MLSFHISIVKTYLTEKAWHVLCTTLVAYLHDICRKDRGRRCLKGEVILQEQLYTSKKAYFLLLISMWQKEYNIKQCFGGHQDTKNYSLHNLSTLSERTPILQTLSKMCIWFLRLQKGITIYSQCCKIIYDEHSVTAAPSIPSPNLAAFWYMHQPPGQNFSQLCCHLHYRHHHHCNGPKMFQLVSWQDIREKTCTCISKQMDACMRKPQCSFILKLREIN